MFVTLFYTEKPFIVDIDKHKPRHTHVQTHTHAHTQKLMSGRALVAIYSFYKNNKTQLSKNPKTGKKLCN